MLQNIVKRKGYEEFNEYGYRYQSAIILNTIGILGIITMFIISYNDKNLKT